MNTKNQWMLVIFVALTQMAILLFGELVLFGWLREASHQNVTEKVLQGNRLLAERIQLQFQHRLDPAQSANGNASLDDLIATISHLSVPDLGFISITDAQTGELLYETVSRDANHPADRNWGNVALVGNSQTLLEQLAAGKQEQPVCGVVDAGFEKQFVAFAPIAGTPFLVSVHRLDSVVNANQNSALTAAQRFGFLFLLILCLAGSLVIHYLLACYRGTMNQVNQDLELMVNERADQLVRTQNAVIFGLAKLSESRDNDTGEHLDRIRSYVTILAEDLKRTQSEVDEAFIEHLAVASSLHDIGKVGIPDSILLKPGRLTEKERGIMEKHTIIGGECLEAIQNRLGNNEFLRMATEVAYAHHERWDGKGYPHGIAGPEIPLVARIVSVADVYDALTSKRPYKRAMSHEESRNIIVQGSGSQFDPQVVDAFLRHEFEFELISIKQQFINDQQATSSFQRLAEAVAQQYSDSTEQV